jgi:8-oxo-dGTP pyrophosphatase MutT (NUDIX family)
MMPHIHKLYDFTASAFIMHPTEPKLCLHFHKKLHMWMQVGGHVELNEDPDETLEKELQEEVGLDKTKYDVIEPYDRPSTSTSKSLNMPFHFEVHEYQNGHKHIDLEYLIKSKTTKLQPMDGESTEIGWFTRAEITDLNNKNMMFRDVFDKCEWIFEHKL